MAAPDGFKKLPNDIKCRCFHMWQEADGSMWCCGKSKTLAGIEEIAGDPTGISSFQADLAKRILDDTYEPM